MTDVNKSDDSSIKNISRRSLLKMAALAGGAVAAGALRRLWADNGDVPLWPGDMATNANPKRSGTTVTTTTQPMFRARSLVVQVRNERVLDGTLVNQRRMLRMLDQSCSTLNLDQHESLLTGLLTKDDVIGLVCDQYGSPQRHCLEGFVQAVVTMLTEQGFDRSKIVLIHAPHALTMTLGTQPMKYGWQDTPTDFGSGKDYLASWLEQVTAIINLPFIKTHTVTKFSGALHNLFRASIRRPGKWYDKAGNPQIADVVNMPVIRDKIKLHLANGLWLLLKGGPHVDSDYLVKWSGMLASTDPVALDSTAADIIERIRLERGLGHLTAAGDFIPYLVTASSRGLGKCNPDDIDLAVL